MKNIIVHTFIILRFSMKGGIMRKQETTELINIIKELCCLVMNETNNPTKFRLILWILEQRWIAPRLFFEISNRE